jgi:hypothetical protein
MLAFDSEDLFPLIDGSVTYADAQSHAAEVDAWLGIATEDVEARLRSAAAEVSIQGHQLWIGLPVKALQTPYTELRELLERLAPKAGETVIDLGAAYGRMGFVLDEHAPGVEFIGYEFVGARVREGQQSYDRHGLKNARLLEADLSHAEFHLPSAEYYFLYDYGNREAIDKTLEDLREIAQAKAITVVGRGRASRDAIERGAPWLSQVVLPEHFLHYSIYRSHDKAEVCS